MTPIRFGTNKVMIGVALIAVNMAVVRSLLLLGYHYSITAILLLIWVMLECALIRACNSQGRRRTFWFGFAGSGACVTLSILNARALPNTALFRFWAGYFFLFEGPAASRLSGKIFLLTANSLPLRISPDIIIATAIFLPPFLGALFGGLVASLIDRRASPAPNPATQGLHPGGSP